MFFYILNKVKKKVSIFIKLVDVKWLINNKSIFMLYKR